MEKEKLKEILLSKGNYDAEIYRLLVTPELDNILTKIDDSKVVSNVNPNEIISAEEQVVMLLNRYFNFFKEKYYHLNPIYAYIIQNLINQNEDLFYNYLSVKYYLGDGNYRRFFEDSLNRLSISNFVKNAKYIPELNNFFKSKRIKVKDIEKYTFKEVLKISKLLSGFTLAIKNQFFTLYLFLDLKKIFDNSKNKKEQLEDVRSRYVLMIEDYLKKENSVKIIQEINS